MDGRRIHGLLQLFDQLRKFRVVAKVFRLLHRGESEVCGRKMCTSDGVEDDVGELAVAGEDGPLVVCSCSGADNLAGQVLNRFQVSGFGQYGFYMLEQSADG